MAKTVVALYESFPVARRAVEELKAAGIPDRSISIAAHDRDERYARELGVKQRHDSKADDGAGTGATAGAVIGGSAGLLAGCWRFRASARSSPPGRSSRPSPAPASAPRPAASSADSSASAFPRSTRTAMPRASAAAARSSP